MFLMAYPLFLFRICVVELIAAHTFRFGVSFFNK